MSDVGVPYIDPRTASDYEGSDQQAWDQKKEEKVTEAWNFLFRKNEVSSS
jgi:hypothetical protein